MNYPIWHIPYIGGTWLIGFIASVHVFISHFAVGGGMFFALTEWIAYKNQDNKLYDYLKKHSLFFLILTTVSGAVTGVGIWWAISLVSPDGTGTLIQTYTLGWATEYLFFVAELATIFVYYYSWDKVSQKTHLALAQWYAGLSVMTLVIINGILSFMLTPGKWIETGYWLQGFFNETYWPSLFIRLIVMAAIAGMYALISSSRIQDLEFKSYMLKYSSKWFLPLFFLGPVFLAWYFFNVPPKVIENIMGGIQNSGVGNFSILARAIYLSLIMSGTILLFAFVGPYLNAKGFSFRSALVFAFTGLIVTGVGEWSREMLRKPYVVYDYMYSNGIRKADIPKFNLNGFVANAKWVSKEDTKDKLLLGQKIFKFQCMQCHTLDGYRGIKNLLAERDQEAILSLLKVMKETDPEKNPYLGIMPPLVGTDRELEALSEYLSTINQEIRDRV
jgi:cytochrome bd ubiquinol oxidase subunit I